MRLDRQGKRLLRGVGRIKGREEERAITRVGCQSRRWGSSLVPAAESLVTSSGSSLTRRLRNKVGVRKGADRRVPGRAERIRG